MHPNRADTSPNTNSVRSAASWGGSVASAGPAAGAAGPDLHQGAQVTKAATEGGPQPQRGETQHDDATRQTDPAPARRARQRPRQSPDRKRRHQPNTRFNDEEFTAVKAAADACGLSLAGFLAHAALTAARDLERTAATVASEREVIAELFAARRHLGWVGSNLNQVARVLNTGGDAPHIDTTIRVVRTAAERVGNAATRLLNQQTPPA